MCNDLKLHRTENICNLTSASENADQVSMLAEFGTLPWNFAEDWGMAANVEDIDNAWKNY
jgi:hypothetical protein